MQPMTISDTIHAYTVLDAAMRNARVARLMPHDRVVVGTARRVATESGATAVGEDIRTVGLWVVVDHVGEVYWPMAELMPQIETGEFVANYKDHH